MKVVGAPVGAGLGVLVSLCTVLSIGALASCSSFGGGDEASPDAAPAEASTQDAGTGDAAGIDGAVDAGTSFCALRGPAAYCEDFDTSADVALLELEGTSTPGGPTGRLTRDTFTSAPRALALDIPPGLDSGFAVLKRAVTTTRPVRLSWDWRVGVLAKTSGQNFQLMTVRRGDAQVALQRICGTTEPFVCEWSLVLGFPSTATYQFFPLPASLAAEVGWSRVSIEVDFALEDGHIVMVQDGAKLLERTAPTLKTVPSATEPTSATVGLGLLQGRTGATELLFDSVVVEEL